MEEVFKPIEGYEGIYEVSNLGRIKSFHRVPFKILKDFKSGDNYRAVGLRKNGLKKTKLVHILVGTYFVENPNKLPELNHLDFDRSNNRADNLRWDTHGDNIRYSYIEGNRTGARGENSPVAKHTEENILKIRELYTSGKYTQNEIAEMFGVKRHNISKIVLRQRWKHI